MQLNTNWLTEHIIDAEYKRYILLAYLQHVHRDFSETRLYPHLADLVSHYRNLLDFDKTIRLMKEEERGELKGIDAHNLKLVYDKTLGNDALMQELEEIVHYSIPRFREQLEEGKGIYEEVEYGMTLQPIGIVPLYKDEGYLLLRSEPNYETRVYQYKLSLIEQVGDRFRAIHTHYLDTFRNSLVYTFEAIKRDLIKSRKDLPNPATWLIEAEKQYPVNETLLPIAQRMLVRYLYSKGA